MRSFLLVSLLPLLGCPGGDDTDSTDPTDTDVGELLWYTTCGDPVCRGYTGPFEGVDACTDEVDGDPCATADARCDPMNDCNALLVCATSDPKDQPGGCPISQAEVKRDIRYLDAAGVQATARQALDLKLATWRYRWEPAGASHLGFLIDDAPQSPAVRADGERVDLYGYTSLALAAVQAQQAEIEALRAEVQALREACAPALSTSGMASTDGVSGEQPQR